MGRICEILRQSAESITMEDNYLRVGDVVVDEKAERYVVKELEEKEDVIIIDKNPQYAIDRWNKEHPGITRAHVPNTERKVMRAIIKLDRPIENGTTLEHKMCAFFEKD
jgi:hypothetical protein